MDPGLTYLSRVLGCLPSQFCFTSGDTEIGGQKGAAQDYSEVGRPDQAGDNKRWLLLNWYCIVIAVGSLFLLDAIHTGVVQVDF